jgi:hypothetical protein
VAAVLLGLLGHQADVGHRAHRGRVEGAVGAAVVDDGLVDAGVGAVGDDREGVGSWPSGPHMWPEVRIIAGIEASTMTSLGTCRLVMPLSEFTIARRGPVGEALLDGGLDLVAVGQGGEPVEDAAEAVVGGQAGGGEVGAVALEDLGKKGFTTWPKMIGSLTFIIVALRCTEKSTSSALARAICSRRKVVEGGRAHDGGVDDLTLEDLRGRP